MAALRSQVNKTDYSGQKKDMSVQELLYDTSYDTDKESFVLQILSVPGAQ